MTYFENYSQIFQKNIFYCFIMSFPYQDPTKSIDERLNDLTFLKWWKKQAVALSWQDIQL